MSFLVDARTSITEKTVGNFKEKGIRSEEMPVNNLFSASC
jgi:hypothetical protein